MDKFVLEITKGKRKGEIIEINKDNFSIGRAEDNDLVLTDGTISRHQCFIVKIDDKYELVDKSKNGTYVNGKFINKEKVPLHPNDIIEIGIFVLRFKKISEESKNELRKENTADVTAEEKIFLMEQKEEIPKTMILDEKVFREEKYENVAEKIKVKKEDKKINKKLILSIPLIIFIFLILSVLFSPNKKSQENSKEIISKQEQQKTNIDNIDNVIIEVKKISVLKDDIESGLNYFYGFSPSNKNYLYRAYKKFSSIESVSKNINISDVDRENIYNVRKFIEDSLDKFLKKFFDEINRNIVLGDNQMANDLINEVILYIDNDLNSKYYKEILKLKEGL